VFDIYVFANSYLYQIMEYNGANNAKPGAKSAKLHRPISYQVSTM